MNKFTCLFLCLLSALTLTNCGFSPMYGKHTNQAAPDIGIEDHLALTSINTIPNREGQILRNILVDRFHRHGTPQSATYALSITPIQESTTDLDITKTADSTRAQLRLSTSITLTDTVTGKPLFTKSLRSITSYNILASEFSTRISEQSTRKNALRDLSNQIETALGLYFKRQQN